MNCERAPHSCFISRSSLRIHHSLFAFDIFPYCLYGFPYEDHVDHSDPVFRNLKRRAAERNETLSALVTEYLVQGLRETRKPKRPLRLPSFKMGWPPKVNIADREALYDFLEAERDERLYGVERKG